MKHRYRFHFAALIAAMLLAGASCSLVSKRAPNEGPGIASIPPASDTVSITIAAADFRFIPAEMGVESGRTVVLGLVNKGQRTHSIRLELPVGPLVLNPRVPPGKSATLTFQAPNAPGRYVFYCPVSGHRLWGMEGRLIVGPPMLPSIPA